MNDIIKAAKILGASFILGIGTLSCALCGHSFGRDVSVWVVYVGAWLLFTAWAGSNPIRWVVIQFNRFLIFLEPPPSLKQDSPSADASPSER